MLNGVTYTWTSAADDGNGDSGSVLPNDLLTALVVDVNEHFPDGAAIEHQLLRRGNSLVGALVAAARWQDVGGSDGGHLLDPSGRCVQRHDACGVA